MENASLLPCPQPWRSAIMLGTDGLPVGRTHLLKRCAKRSRQNAETEQSNSAVALGQDLLSPGEDFDPGHKWKF